MSTVQPRGEVPKDPAWGSANLEAEPAGHWLWGRGAVSQRGPCCLLSVDGQLVELIAEAPLLMPAWDRWT